MIKKESTLTRDKTPRSTPVNRAASLTAEDVQLEQVDLYFNVLRFVTALVREQAPASPVQVPAIPTSPTVAPAVPLGHAATAPVSEHSLALQSTFSSTLLCYSAGDVDNKSLTINQSQPSGLRASNNVAFDVPDRQPSGSNPTTNSSSTPSSGSSFTHQQSGARNNRVTLPPELTEPLEQFRMAVTNLPIDDANIKTTRHVLYEAVMKAFPRDDITTNRLFGEAEGSEHLGGSSSIRNDCGHRFSSTDDMQTMQEILPGLWCGSYHPATNKATLTRHGITHILSCIGTAARFPGEFMFMSIPLSDSPDFNIIPFLHRTFEFIENALIRENGGVLVHCGAGISRAPTITAAYLMRKLRIPSKQAIHMVQVKRPYASPNAGFCRQLRTYGRQLQLREPQEAAVETSGVAVREGKDAALKALALQKKPEPGSVAAAQGKGKGVTPTSKESPVVR